MDISLPPWNVPPGLILIAAAPIIALLNGTVRKVVQVVVPLVVLWQVIALHGATDVHASLHWLGVQTDLLHIDRIRLMFGTIFAIMGLIGSVYALHVEDNAQHPAAWIYAGGALGVTFSGDLLAFVLFWELMGISSSILIFARRTPRSKAAGLRYLAVHGLGGAVLVVGIMAWAMQGHGFALPPGGFPLEGELSTWLILFGVCVNVALPPLGAWLPDAYGEGTVTGSVFLSAFTTKTAVFALLVLFPGWQILLYGGVIMSLYGVVYAVLENNIRRLLAYHIISQVGYMVAAAGMGTQMSIDGGSAHAFSHILYKSLLFMGAGSVVYATGKEKMTELGGLVRKMPWALALYSIGAVSISGWPLFNGFVSKSMIISAAGQGGWPIAAVALTVASVGTFLHTGLKMLWFTFVSPLDREHEEVKKLPWNMYAAMGIGAALCTFTGMPGGYQFMYDLLPNMTEYHPYTLHHVTGSLQLLAMTALAFWWLFDKLWGQPTVSMDTDWFYRKPLPPLVLGISRGIFAGQQAFGRFLGRVANGAVDFLSNPLRFSEKFIGRGMFEVAANNPTDDPDYTPARYRLPVGTTLLFVLGVFAAVAVLHLVFRA